MKRAIVVSFTFDDEAGTAGAGADHFAETIGWLARVHVGAPVDVVVEYDSALDPRWAEAHK